MQASLGIKFMHWNFQTGAIQKGRLDQEAALQNYLLKVCNSKLSDGKTNVICQLEPLEENKESDYLFVPSDNLTEDVIELKL